MINLNFLDDEYDKYDFMETASFRAVRLKQDPKMKHTKIEDKKIKQMNMCGCAAIKKSHLDRNREYPEGWRKPLQATWGSADGTASELARVLWP